MVAAVPIPAPRKAPALSKAPSREQKKNTKSMEKEATGRRLIDDDPRAIVAEDIATTRVSCDSSSPPCIKRRPTPAPRRELLDTSFRGLAGMSALPPIAAKDN